MENSNQVRLELKLQYIQIYTVKEIQICIKRTGC